jgi:hypothetical protein
MFPITMATTVEDILAAVPGAAAIFARHGCEVEAECPQGIHALSLSEVEIICYLRDMPGLIADLHTAAGQS